MKQQQRRASGAGYLPPPLLRAGLAGSYQVIDSLLTELHAAVRKKQGRGPSTSKHRPPTSDHYHCMFFVSSSSSLCSSVPWQRPIDCMPAFPRQRSRMLSVLSSSSRCCCCFCGDRWSSSSITSRGGRNNIKKHYPCPSIAPHSHYFRGRRSGMCGDDGASAGRSVLLTSTLGRLLLPPSSPHAPPSSSSHTHKASPPSRQPTTKRTGPSSPNPPNLSN